MMLNATFNTMSAISWRSVLLVEKATNLPEVTDKLHFVYCWEFLGTKTAS